MRRRMFPASNYSDDFEVPVFRLTPSPQSASSSTIPFSLETTGPIAPPAFESDASDVPAPANPKVVVSTGMNGGTEFYFPAFRNPSRVLGMFLFTVVWSTIIYFIRHSQAPWIFAAVFELFEVLLVYGLVQSAFGSCRIGVGDGKIVFRRALLGVGRTGKFLFPRLPRFCR